MTVHDEPRQDEAEIRPLSYDELSQHCKKLRRRFRTLLDHILGPQKSHCREVNGWEDEMLVACLSAVTNLKGENMTGEAKPDDKMVIVEVRFLTPMPVQGGRVVGPGQRPGGMQMAFPRIVVGQPAIHPLTEEKTTVVCILPVPQGVMVHYAEGGPCVITNQPMQVLFGPATDTAGEPKWAGEKVLVQ